MKRIFRRSQTLAKHYGEIAGKQALVQYQQHAHPFLKQAQGFLTTHRLFTGIVVIPWLIGAFYTCLIEKPVYVSTAKIIVEKDLETNPINISAGIFGGGTANNETYLTQEYLTSREMLNNLQGRFDYKTHYQSPKLDFISRLKNHPSENELLDYFQKQITATVDTKTNEINLQVKAFNPEIAKKLAQDLIIQAKPFVNRVANSMAYKQFNFAKKQLKLAKKKLLISSQKILEWQNEHGMFDPTESARVVSEVMAQLKGKLVEKQTELIAYSAFMQPNSSKIVGLKEEIQAIKIQIKTQTKGLLGKREGASKLNEVLKDYEWVQLQLKFAQAEYQGAQGAFDAASISLNKQINSIIEIEKPNLPDEYEYPKRIYELTNLLVLLLVLFFLIKMTINIVNEHID